MLVGTAHVLDNDTVTMGWTNQAATSVPTHATYYSASSLTQGR